MKEFLGHHNQRHRDEGKRKEFTAVFIGNCPCKIELKTLSGLRRHLLSFCMQGESKTPGAGGSGPKKGRKDQLEKKGRTEAASTSIQSPRIGYE